MNKYIDAEKLKKSIGNYVEGAHAALNPIDGNADYYKGKIDACKDMQEFIASLQHEQPMPDSTKLIELWHQDKEMLKEKDFRGDPWRLAYNAFMCGLGRGIAVNKQEQPKFKVGELIVSKYNPHLTYKILAINIPNELGKTDYKVEIFTDGKPGLLGKPHNIRLISSDKIEDWGELVQQEQPEVDLEKEMEKYMSSKDESGLALNRAGFTNPQSAYKLARHFYELGLNAKKED